MEERGMKEKCMMYHPVVQRYAHNYGEDPAFVARLIRDALEDSDRIMEITWRTLGVALGKGYSDDEPYNTCKKVFMEGWEYDEETKKLKSLFESFVKPINEEMKLEDWM
jgi:hypothetical protein